MKLVVALAIVLSACGGGTDGECKVDGDCGDGVCARNGECLPESAVRSSRVTWTIRGMAANATSCAGSPNFYILFYAGVGDTFGFEPVPCAAGVFTIDKLPKRFVSVEIGIEGRFEDDRAFDSQGNASFDLYP